MTDRQVRLVAAALSVAAAAGCSDTGSHATPTTPPEPPATHQIRVTSSAVAEGTALPDEYTCAGTGETLPLSWTTPPEIARFALVVDDPDAPGGVFTHWIVIDIPATTTAVAEGGFPEGGTALLNSSDRPDYFAPCPPPGSGTHHYRFTVYALPNRLSLPPQSPLAQSLTAIEGSAVAQGTLTATYRR